MRWLRQFYEKCTLLAQKPSALPILGGFSFIESIFFPLPTDPVLIAVCAARPKRSLWASLWAILPSVLGGCVGYLLGYYFSDFAREFLLKYFISLDDWQVLMQAFQAGSFLFVFIGGFTPLPFKAFTITSGLFGAQFWPFLLGAFIGRGLRFGVIGVLFFFFGGPIKDWIDKHFETAVWILTGLILLLAALYVFL